MKDPRTDSKIDLESKFKIKSEKKKEKNIPGPNWISKLNSYT